MPQTSQENLELLKQDFESELKNMKLAGEELLRQHPRYETQAKELIDIANKKLVECNENMFSIALGADFQAGKSTTVNAMSDGRIICPSGNGGGGIRTSSCAVKVNYGASNPTVIWKSKDTLSRDLEYWTGGQVSLTEQDNATRQAAFNEIAKDMSAKLATRETVTVDKMHQVLLYMSYYNHPQVTDWLSKNTFSSEEILAFLAFPDDNDSRWGKVHKKILQIESPSQSQLIDIVRNEFYPTNAMYLFIEMVNFTTPSEYLHAMGITVIDTPGLNMTDNDTRVALSCMSDATSIFYFFDGEKQLDEADKKALKLIDDLGFKNKVFFGINFRSPLYKKVKVREAIQNQLQDLGYNAPHQQQLLLFNAFLAQRARQGQLILDGKLNRNDEDKIFKEAEAIESDAQTVEQAWLETTANVMGEVKAVKGLNEDDFIEMGLTKETINLVYKASRWDDVMNFILDYVLENRSRALLIERVAKPITAQLTAIEKVLRRDEENATQTAGDLRKKYNDAIKSYKDFQRECKEKVAYRIKEDWDRAIAVDFYQNVYEKCSSDIAAEAVDKIQRAQTFLNNVGFLLTGAVGKIRGFFGMDQVKSKLELECAAIMKSATEKIVEQLTITWIAKFETGTIYQNTIRASVEALHEDILKIWNERNMTDNEILKDLLEQLKRKLPTGEFSSDSENIELPGEALSEILGKQVQFGGAAKDTLKGLVGGIIGGSGVLYVYLFILPMDFVVPFAAEIVGIITLALAAIIAAFSNSSRRERDRQKLKQSLEDAMNRVFFNPEKREEIINNLINGTENSDGKVNPGIKIYRLFYSVAFESAIKNCGDILAAQAKKAEEDALKGDKARELIASEAKQIREGVIATLQKAMNDLQRKVDTIFPPANF
ncbi:MAG: dynamin family protein [Selenomonadaceae bacterium]|nr:dynamin family protein [Selenomonadaceae bacterium]